MTSWPLNFSSIGIGSATFGREIDQTMAFTIMDHAWKNRITHFDTAQAYSNGAAEAIIGAWLASRRPNRDAMVLATKILRPYAADKIESAVARSLERLGQSSLDILYFHGWHDSATDSGVLAALDKLSAQGRIRALGASNFTAEQLDSVLKRQRLSGYSPIRVLQNNNNFAVRTVDEPLQSLCKKEGIAIVTYSPLGAGFLTGKHKQKVEPGSRFDVAPGHKDVYFHDICWKRLEELEAIGARTGFSKVELAYAWAFSRPGISSVLVGARSLSHIDQALAARSIDAGTIFP